MILGLSLMGGKMAVPVRAASDPTPTPTATPNPAIEKEMTTYLQTLTDSQLREVTGDINKNTTVPGWFEPPCDWSVSDLPMIVKLANEILKKTAPNAR